MARAKLLASELVKLAGGSMQNVSIPPAPGVLHIFPQPLQGLGDTQNTTRRDEEGCFVAVCLLSAWDGEGGGQGLVSEGLGWK